MSSLFTRWPTWSFLLLGLVLFLAYQTIFPQRPQIIITDKQFAWVLANWYRQHASPPSAKQRLQLIEETIEEELLYQEALARGLHYSSAVQTRLAKLNSYLEDTESLDTASQETVKTAPARAWQAQDYLTTDPLIRSYLVTSLRQQLQQNTIPAAIEEQQLKNYFAQHKANFVNPARVGFYHLYFSGFDENTVARANAVRAQLLADKPAPNDAIKRGDVFYGGHYIAPNSEAQIQAQLGGELAATLFELPKQRWSKPIRSAYGWHLVYINKLIPETIPEFPELREKIAALLRDEARRQALPKTLAELRKHYDIRVVISES